MSNKAEKNARLASPLQRFVMGGIIFVFCWSLLIGIMELYFKVETKVLYTLAGFFMWPLADKIDDFILKWKKP